MGAEGGKLATITCKTLNITSGSSSSSNSLNDVHQENKDKDIEVEQIDKYKGIKYIISVEVPATNSCIDAVNISAKILTGSKFVHEGLIIQTYDDTYYVCQVYPIQLKKCENEEDAVKKIKNRWSVNKNVKDENLKKTYLVSNEQICMTCLKEIVEKLPNKYDLFTYNCQHFCSKIKEILGCRRKPNHSVMDMIFGGFLVVNHISCHKHGCPKHKSLY